MKILHILKSEPEESIKKIVDIQRMDNEVYIFELFKNRDHELLVRLIENCDKIMSW